MRRWFAVLALLAAVVLLVGPMGNALASAGGEGRGAHLSGLHKDGEDDSGGSDDGSSDDSSSSDNSGSGADDGGSVGGSDDAVDAGGGSDDSEGGGEIDDSGQDGSADLSGSGGGSDDNGFDDHGGNDDFELESPAVSADGVQPPVVDDDGSDETDGFRAGQAIVRLQPRADIAAYNQRHGTSLVAAIPSRSLYLLDLPAGADAAALERELANDADTRWSELNYVNQTPEGRPGYFFVSGAPAPAAGPVPSLLGISTAQQCSTGVGTTVAVLDTGIDAGHPALEGRVLANGWNALNDSTDVRDTGNGADDDGDGLADEMVGHGTHVAGIIAQVAPGASILPVKVLGSDGSGDAFFVAAGIYYAVDQGADVINLSLSSTYDARVIAEAVAEASEAGVTVVAAAGNGATDRILEFPAADTGVIAVAATDAADAKSAFSNFGTDVDLAAPGEGIVSALPGGAFAAWSGTSMAAPFVAGAAALIAQVHPSWTSPQITKRLERTATDLDPANPAYAGALGAGRLDVAAAVACPPSTADSAQVTS